MKKQASTEKDLDPESVKRRTELFTKYVLPHKRLIFSICIKYTYDRLDIEDNYNEVLVNFFRYIESYNPERPLKSWLYSVAQRHVFEMNRRNSVFQWDKNVDMGTIPNIAQEDDPHTNCMDMDNYKQYYNDDILKALEKLSPIHKEALLLQQAGYKMDEIVEISFQNGLLKSKNMDTIKSRIFLAKKQMRTLITRDGDAKTE